MASYHAGYDHPRGARHVLMDYMQGKLLYCFPPPTAPDMNIYAPIINAYYDAMEKVGLASVREEEEEEEEGRLPHDLHSVSTRHHAAAANVLDVPDTSALFTIPVPKPKSAKASVAMSRHKPRKGRRDPDPYGTHAAADPVSVMVLEELQALALEAKVDGGEGGKARKHGPGITPEALLGKGKGRANASTFTRVQRPYSAK